MSLADGAPPTKPKVRQRSTRDRPAKSPLSEEAVVDAALAILKKDGLEAVTMRRVATALDTGAASLYVYVDGREGLLQQMLDRVTATIKLETPDPKRWREQLHTVLRRLHDTMAAHPGIAGMTLAAPPTTPAVLTFSENLLGILLAGGLEPQDAVWANDIFVSLVKSVTTEDVVRHTNSEIDSEQRDAFYKTIAALPPDQFPLITQHATHIVTGNSDERLNFAIDVIIDGVIAQEAQR